MASEGGFDPYLKWLGIHPKDQPPHHYRLLGIDAFESDPDVIANAADARMVHIRTYQTGRYSAVSQQILNEIAAAKVVLLSGPKKAEYDAQLRAALTPRAPQREAPAGARSSGPPPLPRADLAGEEPAGAPRRFSLALVGLARDWRVWTAVAAMAGLLAVAAGVAVLWRPGGGQEETLVAEQSPLSGNQDSTAEGSGERGAEPAGQQKPDEARSGRGEPGEVAKTVGTEKKPAAAGKPEPGTEPMPGESSNPSAKPGTTSQPETSSNPGTTAKPDANPKPETSSNPDTNAKPEANPKPETSSNPDTDTKPDTVPKAETSSSPGTGAKPEATPKPETTSKPEAGAKEGPAEVASEPVKKLPVPDAQSQQAAGATIREIFKADFASLKTPAEKLALADKLFRQALATRDDPAAEYTLFRLACDLAEGAGEIPRTLDAIDEIARRFEIDAVAMKAQVLEKAVVAMRNAPLGSPASHDLAEGLLRLTDEAMAGDEFEVASKLAKLAVPAARKAADPELVREAAARGRVFGRLQQQFVFVEKALGRLQDSPDDPKANLKVGRWYCFIKGQWEKGLPYLVKCGQAELTSLAEMDMAGPTEPAKQVEVAEGWSKYAQTEEDDAVPQIELRAGHWLKQALPSLSGLEKVSAEKQLEAIAKVKPLVKPRPRGAVKPGNVALAANGTTIVGPNATAEYLIDGNTTDYSLKRDTARGVCPCQWTMTFDKVYSLREIRLLLFDRDKNLSRRLYWYAVAVSSDGEMFTLLADRGKRSKGSYYGWQLLRLPARPVKAIRLFGLNESGDRTFYAVELEAYCVPPQTLPGAAPAGGPAAKKPQPQPPSRRRGGRK